MHKNGIHVVSRGVMVDQGHILLAYDPRARPFHYYELHTHFYYLPGGHINFHESAENALIREIKEETGLDTEIEKFLGMIEHAWSFPGDEVCCHTHEINLIFKICMTGLSFGDTLAQRGPRCFSMDAPCTSAGHRSAPLAPAFCLAPLVIRHRSRCFLQHHKPTRRGKLRIEMIKKINRFKRYAGSKKQNVFSRARGFIPPNRPHKMQGDEFWMMTG